MNKEIFLKALKFFKLRPKSRLCLPTYPQQIINLLNFIRISIITIYSMFQLSSYRHALYAYKFKYKLKKNYYIIHIYI